MKISVTDRKWVDNKIRQFTETAKFADAMDVSAATPETIKSVITDLTRIVYDYCSDLEKVNAKKIEMTSEK